MIPTKEQIIYKLQEAKNIYGISYSNIAKEVNITPVSISNFVHNHGTISREKQIQIACVAEQHIQEIKKQLQILEHNGMCTSQNF